MASKIDYTQLQNESEVQCAELFIHEYNRINETNFQDIVKNDIQNEIDIYCYTTNQKNQLKIQVKKSDPVMVGNLGKSMDVPIFERQATIRDGDQFVKRILNHLLVIENKYDLQNKDVSDIILLLDEMNCPPEYFLKLVIDGIRTSNFKEIWVASRNGIVQKLH